MKILIVENDPLKSSQIELFLQEIGLANSEINICKSFQSGLESILTKHYDFLILDMSIPTFDITEMDDGGETLDRGGEIILQEMEREGIKIKALILTQYEEFGGVSLEEIDNTLKEEFPDFYLGCIYYNTIQVNWQNELKEIILKNSK
jgi:CheY-like chemotaxis protein